MSQTSEATYTLYFQADGFLSLLFIQAFKAILTWLFLGPASSIYKSVLKLAINGQKEVTL
jgi:hypothetical protein